MEPTRLEIEGAGGVRLVADAWGSPGDAPVVFLHGGGQTRHSWGRTARDLARAGWYALSVDLRGHGESDWAPDGDYSMEAFVEDLRAVIGEIGTPPVHVGASLGGVTALLALGESPAVPGRALVLVDVAPRLDAEGVGRILDFMTGNPDGFATLEEAADAVAAYATHRRRPRDPEGLRKNLRLGPDGRYRWHWDPRFLEGRTRGRRGREGRLEDAARNVRIPTLLVRGGSSDVVSRESVEEFLSLVPGSRAVDVTGAGHMVAGDENDLFTEAVRAFLEDLDSARPA